MEHIYGWSNKPLAPDAEDAEPIIQIPVGHPCLERGRFVKKDKHTKVPFRLRWFFN